ncbi:uncharacterized protein DNG_07224 [Cephalotrichum gorgonifer]|uniref:SGNH hydrolase-type esterase domain-containing protein n=1 Tax=Cephalotrichum gorgonifer TaxID=2041049 RepID=A0AAE8N308_9PEZI|nr:uncharacterized protein DNG_07224 [Cephalotrichum gorgonifer]
MHGGTRSPLTALLLAAGFMLPSLPAVTALPNLRIQTLGDSITKGSKSSDGAGYRSRLRNKLTTNSDISVDMVGSLQDGHMADNNHEGHSGEFLAEIANYWQLSIKARPNVVLVHAGSNNMDYGRDIALAPYYMESIIDGIFDKV